MATGLHDCVLFDKLHTLATGIRPTQQKIRTFALKQILYFLNGLFAKIEFCSPCDFFENFR